jgi:hypothetical protein
LICFSLVISLTFLDLEGDRLALVHEYGGIGARGDGVGVGNRIETHDKMELTIVSDDQIETG